MAMSEKPKLAMYWASSCGGCEISVLNIGDKILTVDAVFDLAFFPCIADFKVADVEGYSDGYIDVCLFNGAIRNSENEEMAHLLRQRSKVRRPSTQSITTTPPSTTRMEYGPNW
jgi:F420-non-reducing hydrogenase small subunit